jgi:hypothetical protein
MDFPFLRDSFGAPDASMAPRRVVLADQRRIEGPTRGKAKVLDCLSIGAVHMLLAGCSSAPSRSILGSYFPSWMICVLVGTLLTIAVRALLVKAGAADALPAPILVYLAFTLAFSFGLWLLWLG